MIIEIMELTATWGCAWKTQDGPVQYGFRDIPGITERASLWLEVAGGAAVSTLLEAELASVISTTPGTYGGTRRTAAIDVGRLNSAAEKYWDRVNAADETARDRTDRRCHYCGSPASKRDFFDAWVCSECQ